MSAKRNVTVPLGGSGIASRPVTLLKNPAEPSENAQKRLKSEVRYARLGFPPKGDLKDPVAAAEGLRLVLFVELGAERLRM
jgi:hypothetical protein